jgi:ABC-type sugar transport system ATPase subunit
MEIRPEDIVHGNLNEVMFEGEPVLVEPTGSSNLISVKVGENELKMFLARPPIQGQPLKLSFSPHQTLFFDAQSGLRLKPDW